MSNYTKDNLIEVPATSVPTGTLAIKIGGEVFTAGNVIIGTDTSDATATSSTLLDGATAYSKGKKITGNIPIIPDVTVQENSVTVRKGYYNRNITKTIGFVYGRSEETPYTSDINIPEDTYILNGLTIKGDSNLTAENIKQGVSIFGVAGSFSGSGGGMEFYRCASVDTANKTWTGYKAVLSDGVYTFEENITAGLTYGTAYTPKQDGIYSADATVQVNKLWIGVPPTDGLIFYAPLTERRDAAETGQSLSYNGNVDFTSIDNMSCASFSGYDYIETSFPVINSDSTLSLWIRYSHFDGEFIIFQQGESSPEQNYGIGAYNGNIQLNSYSNDIRNIGSPSSDRWHHIAVVHSGNTITAYMDGVVTYNDEWNVSLSIESSTAYINRGSGGSGNDGYISSCRVYNRALTSAEISQLANEFTPAT